MKIKGKEYTDISKLSVRPISKSAKDIIIKNHYSGIWTKVSYCLGLYVEDDSHSFFSSTDKLIGVATYGDPIGRHSGQSISELLDRKEVLELQDYLYSMDMDVMLRVGLLDKHLSG